MCGYRFDHSESIRLLAAHHDRNTGFNDSCLLTRYTLKCLPQMLGVVDRDGSNDGESRSYGIRSIEASPHTDLQHSPIDLPELKVTQCKSRCKFKKGRRHSPAQSAQLLYKVDHVQFSNRSTVNLDAFSETV